MFVLHKFKQKLDFQNFCMNLLQKKTLSYESSFFKVNFTLSVYSPISNRSLGLFTEKDGDDEETGEGIL